MEFPPDGDFSRETRVSRGRDKMGRARPTKPAHLRDWLPKTVSRLRKKSGFVSGYRFSDTA